jgi:hypothetical protein
MGGHIKGRVSQLLPLGLPRLHRQGKRTVQRIQSPWCNGLPNKSSIRQSGLAALISLTPRVMFEHRN